VDEVVSNRIAELGQRRSRDLTDADAALDEAIGLFARVSHAWGDVQWFARVMGVSKPTVYKLLARGDSDRVTS
jgi:hypothetical protein